MKKLAVHFKKIVTGIIFIALVAVIVLLYFKITELTNQMAYLQDTTDVILSDVGSLQSNFEKTLEEENSMIESYTIDVTGMDFTEKTYSVDVTVIPKEYTDETKVSVFFGTAECALTADGYTYSGSITLPLEKTFDGNLTFLIANGKKKNTEVISDYAGLYNHLDQVLTGSLSREAAYEDGVVKAQGECTYSLDGADIYEFESLDLVIELDGNEIGEMDLLAAALEADASEAGEAATEEQAEVLATELPVSGISGTYTSDFTYYLKDYLEEGEELPEIASVRVFLRAVSTEGYRFECEISGGSERIVYDKKGGSYELSDNVTETE